MIEIKGKGNISAKIIADSISEAGVRITTLEIDFPRWILAENNTHRMLSKNGASSRAIPIKTAIENVRKWKVKPIRWLKNQAGMSAKNEEIDNVSEAERIWDDARESAILAAEKLSELGLHKQWVSRLIEPFSMMKMVTTATEFANFFHLRCHADAQPEIHELADCMREAMEQSTPTQLEVGDWHTPYFGDGHWYENLGNPFRTQDYPSLQDALMISASCAAQVSYRKHDESIEKARDVYKRLMESSPKHSSPFEHQATPMKLTHTEEGFLEHDWSEGVTHQDRFNNLWSGNMKGWIQNRQLIPGHVVW